MMVAARPSGTRALELCKFDRVPLGPPPACRVDRPGGGARTSDRSIRICRKLGQAGSCTYHTLVMSPLPLCRIPSRVQNGEYDDDISFHREVHDVGKASKQRAADSGSDPESSGDRRRHGRAARGWDRGDTRRAALQQGLDATPALEPRRASRRCCPRELAHSGPVQPSRGS